MKAQNHLDENQAEKIEARQELRRNIIIGSILRTLHRKQGTMSYLIQAIEPYLKKSDRQLFGLYF
jgi:hypothetical protein